MSAIAARKARMAAAAAAAEAQAQTAVTAPAEQPTPMSISTSEDDEAAGPSHLRPVPGTEATDGRLTSKRKASSPIQNGHKSSAKKDTRYFAQPPDRSSEKENSEPEGSVDEGSEVDGESEEEENSSGSDLQEESLRESTNARRVWFVPSKKNMRVLSPSLKGKQKADAEADGASAIEIVLALGEVISGQVNVQGATADKNNTRDPQLLFLPDIPPFTGIVGCSMPSATIIIRQKVGTGLESLRRVCPLVPEGAFSKEAQISTRETHHDSLRRLPGISQVPSLLFQAEPSDLAELPASWSDALEDIASPSSFHVPRPNIYLIKGPKGAGKSTFARALFNKARLSQGSRSHGTSDSSIAFLDLDLGQPEFNVPGSLSLFISDGASSSIPLISPNWLTHSTAITPLFSHYLGQTTPKEIPSLYLASVESLFSRFQDFVREQRDPSRVSLVVNTMGWAKGLGSELLARTQEIIQPTQIFDLIPTVLKDFTSGSSSWKRVPLPYATSLPSARGDQAGLRVTPIEAYGLDVKAIRGDTEQRMAGRLRQIPVKNKALSAADKRTLSIMTALYSQPDSTSEPGLPTWDFQSSTLVEQHPISVDVRTGLLGGIQYFPPLADPLDPHIALAGLNGDVVGLAIDVSPFTPSSSSDGSAFPATAIWDHAINLRPCIPLASLHFLCLAVIRSIDVSNGILHLLTPFSLSACIESHPLLSSITLAAEPSSSSPLRLALVKSSIESASGLGSSVDLPIWAHLDATAIAAAMSTRRRNNDKAQRAKPIEGGAAVDTDTEDADLEIELDPTSQQSRSNFTSKSKSKSTLLGMPLDQVPYLEWPPDPPTTSSSSTSSLVAREAAHAPIVGNQKRKVRRNVMRRGQGP